MLWCSLSWCLGAVFPFSWEAGLAGRKEGVVWDVAAYGIQGLQRPLRLLFGGICNGVTCPGEGAWSSHLGALHPGRQQPRYVVPLDVVWGSDSPCLEDSRGALLLPCVCSGLSSGLQPSCCCADVNISLVIFPARVCPTKISSAPCFQHMDLSVPEFCPWALSHNWATSWTSDVSFPHAWADVPIFGSRWGLRSSLGSLLQLKLIQLYLEVAVLWIAQM